MGMATREKAQELQQPHKPRFVAYERVSTARQGASGLGLDAQRSSIEIFAASRHAQLLARFTEVESGRNPDRPELAKALHLAKVTGATSSPVANPSWTGCRAMPPSC